MLDRQVQVGIKPCLNVHNYLLQCVIWCNILEEDQDFDPSAEMMVHDYDDEQTLDEEEAMSNESMGNELDDLQKVLKQKTFE